ncbi:60S ribosomal protein l17-1 [Phtheirospermum japonicum]|uniref:60S ribosomal protein l17-1 n=1 Tax=Phtheirospermum japonicum TaxID=374723 RepID=A0A830D4H5_9LAMI|nr:60S ribosomal protein l17-1 [Phtheirospermum japonicum]
MLLGSFLSPRRKVVWRMYLPTSRPFLSLAFVEVWAELLRQRTNIQMDRVDGLSSLPSSSWVCLRMLRVMLR